MDKIKEEKVMWMPKEISADNNIILDMIVKEDDINFIIDFKQVQTIDIQGLTLIDEQIMTFEKENINYKIRNISDEVNKLFEITGIL